VPWLFAPDEKRALADVARLAAALRSGEVASRFLDGGAPAIPLGAVARVTLLAPADLNLADDARRFVLARGTSRLCLAEVLDGDATPAEAERLLAAAAALSAREGRPVCAWLVARTVSADARALLIDRGGAATSIADP